jgi:predicted dehydrogenase
MLIAALRQEFAMSNVVCLSTAHTHSRGVLKAIAKHEDCKLVAIWDDQEGRGQSFAVISNRSGIYTDVDDNGIALVQFENDCLATIEASWVHTGGSDGLEIIGSEAAIFKHPQDGYVVAAPRKDQKPVVPGDERPSGVNRLAAAMKGELSADELEQDLICAADAVAITEACYQSSETGTWVGVPSMS